MYYFIIFAFILLAGCASNSNLENRVKSLEDAHNELETDLLHQISINTQDIDIINHRIDDLVNWIDSIDKKENIACVPFDPIIGEYVYKNIGNEDIDNTKFWEEVGDIEGDYVKIKVISYAVEGDCVTHINELGPDWIKK